MKKLEQKLKKYLNYLFRLLFEQPQKQPAGNYKRILIFRPGGIGDMILSVPILLSIRLKFPTSRIDILCEPKNAIVLEGLKIVDSIFLYDKKPILIVKQITSLRKIKYEYILNLNAFPSFTFGLVTRLIAPKAIRAAGDQREFSFFFNRDMKILPKNAEHMIDHLFSISKDLASDKNRVLEQPWFDYGTVINLEAQNLYSQLASSLRIDFPNPKIVLVNLSAGIVRREWPTEKIIEFLKIVINKYDQLIDGWAILTNPAEADKSKFIVEELNSNKVIQVSIQNDFRVVISLLKHVYFLITPDTSIAHAASAMGIPVFDLILKENIVTWSPIGSKVKAISPKDFLDLSTLEVHEVLEAFESYLIDLNSP